MPGHWQTDHVMTVDSNIVPSPGKLEVNAVMQSEATTGVQVGVVPCVGIDEWDRVSRTLGKPADHDVRVGNW